MSLSTRLKSARTLRGLSLKEVAERTDATVSLPTLSRYERGEVEPDPAKLRKIARALDLSMDYFLRVPKELGPIAFRKRKRLSKKVEGQILEQTRDFLERFTEAEHLMHVASKDLPRYSQRIHSVEQVEEAAEWLRQEWELGQNPIHSIVDELEAEHIRVLAVHVDARFDGLSSTPGGPEQFIVFNQALPIERQRFTLLHELGHHLLDIGEEVSEEQAVNRFAGAFALPAKVLRERIGHHRSQLHPVELLELKKEFGLSVAALLYRAKDLNIISEYTFRNAMIATSQRGWRKEEPPGFHGDETPSRLIELLGRGIAEECITQSKAAELYGMKLGEFRDVLFKGV